MAKRGRGILPLVLPGINRPTINRTGLTIRLLHNGIRTTCAWLHGGRDGTTGRGASRFFFKMP